MKLKMYEVFRDRTGTLAEKIIYGFLLVIVVCLYIWMITDEYTTPGSLFFAPKEITAGEDLAYYNKKEVTCEIPYVINHAVNFYREELYDEGDEDMEYYTLGYVGVDEDFGNPFIFFVPPDRKEEVEQMLEKTQEIYFEGAPKTDIGSLQVTGYVRKSRERHFHFYEAALINVYGHADFLSADGNQVYVLDDQNVSFGSGWETWMKLKVTLFLVMLVCAIISFRSAMGHKNRTYIRDVLEKYRINEFELNQEFVGATEVAHNYWIGKNYTFFVLGNKPYVLLNNEMVLVYGAKGSFHFHTLDKSRFAIKETDAEIQNLLDYYETHFPRVVIGMNGEIHRMLVSDYDAFLEMKYRKN